MEMFESVGAALDFAIEREQEAVDFYMGLAAQVQGETLKKKLAALANVERGHKEKLQNAKTNEMVLSGTVSVVDMKLSDYLVSVTPSADMSLQDAMVVAIKREQAAMELYNDLAQRVSDAGLKALFERLSGEEAAHKLSFEIDYEDQFLSEN